MDEMMVRYGRISKIAKGILLAAGMTLLISCKGENGGGDVTTISIQADGTIRSNIKESFAQSYYDVDELQQAILAEAADYNKAAGSGRIDVEKVDVDNGVATVLMTYQDCADYAAFNDVLFFAGPVGEVPDGYELNVVLCDVADESKTIGKSDILAMEDCQLLITDIGEPVRLNGKAVYASDNVTVAKNRKSAWITGEGTGYVLYK